MDLIEKAIVNDKGVYLPKNVIIYERKLVKNEILYKFKNAKLVYDALVTYHKSLSEIDNLDFILKHFNFWISGGIPKKIKNVNSSLNSLVDVLTNVSPNPYHV